MLAAAALALYDRFRRSEPSSKRITRTAAIVLPLGTAWFLRNLIPRVLKLSSVGEFYFGGKEGSSTDTIGSLVYTYFYRNAGPPAHQYRNCNRRRGSRDRCSRYPRRYGVEAA